MSRFRRHRFSMRIALFAMLMLLWSQTALAWHAICDSAVSPPVEITQMAGHSSHCDEQAPPSSDDLSLCAAHCDQGEPSPDIARIPALPALPALVPAFAAAFISLPTQELQHTRAPPPIPWNRPTLHPAALLLI